MPITQEPDIVESSGLRHSVAIIHAEFKFFFQIFENACVGGPKAEKMFLQYPL